MVMGTDLEEATLPFQCLLPFTIGGQHMRQQILYCTRRLPLKKLHSKMLRKLFPSEKIAENCGKKTAEFLP